MNLGQLERYAPKARKDLIQAVTAKASKLGISGNAILETKKSGDALIISGNAFPVNIDYKRKVLVDRVEKDGFDKVMEEAAYTWFNRFTAMRYMEIHGYIEEHPFSLFESPDGSSEPEVIRHVADLSDWQELNFNLALDLKTQNKTEELYQLIITVQCHSLGKIIPFLFALDAVEIELLLPEGLLLSDSIIKEMIVVLNEENLSEVESLGWLYQFYISEKKDTLMKRKKAYKADEIPAVTQLFTPNWIVKYLTQNSLGRLWLSTYPASPLKEKMEYYIEPAEQTEEVNTQLEDITPKLLNPEEITILDPACGSGHILIEVYDLLKEIYLERGYQEKEIPRSILNNNLFGLDIDDRAAQLARFVLLMRARKDDKRVFRSKGPINLNVYAIQQTNSLIAKDFQGINTDALDSLVSTFKDAKIFGSLIEIPENLSNQLVELSAQTVKALSSELQSFESLNTKKILPLLKQANVMNKKFDIVVANPPYLGGKGMDQVLKSFAKNAYPEGKNDLFSMFIQRGFRYAKDTGYNAMVTMQSWMFLSSFEGLRNTILSEKTITNLIQIGYNSFPTLNSKIALAVAFCIKNKNIEDYQGTYVNLNSAPQSANKETVFLKKDDSITFILKQNRLRNVPGNPIAYWLSSRMFDVFTKCTRLSEIAAPKQGFATGENDKFLRLWHEVDITKIGFGYQTREDAKESQKKWFPCNKGGPYRKWFGNNEFIVNWFNDGEEMFAFKPRSVIRNPTYYFKKGITWSTITSSHASFRYSPTGTLFETKGSVCFTKNEDDFDWVFAFLNSKVVESLLLVFSPTLDFHEGPLSKLPIAAKPEKSEYAKCKNRVKKLLETARNDWNSLETSWEFESFPLILPEVKKSLLFDSFNSWSSICESHFREVQQLEIDNNKQFIDIYGLQNELNPNVPENQITIIKSNETEEIKRLLSYSAGCMMGRYSLDESGLIYAHSENEDFAKSKYKTFPVDDDGIITLTDVGDLLIRDDLTDRFTDFVKTAWGEDNLSENLKFVADTLGPKNNELPKETIRRWISTDFFKDHLQRYKNRPIYWLFSSGKKKAFEALVYLHRYHEGTLSRMRMKYVVPLQSRISDRLKTIDDDIASASSAQERNKLTRKKKLLADKELELREYDETLRHLAEQQIKLDLDDGVKINYGKFPGLLAETKKVCGK